MVNQAPPSSAWLHTGGAVDEIDALLGLYHRPARPRLLGPRPQKHYFISHADQHPSPGDWQGVDLVLVATSTPLEVQESIRVTSADQTLGLNMRPQRPDTSQMTMLDASPIDPRFGRSKVWGHMAGKPADMTGIQQDALSAAGFQNAFAKLAPGENRARTFTVYVRQTEPKLPSAPEGVRQIWKASLDISKRAMSFTGIPSPASEHVVAFEHLLPKTMGKATSALPTDLEPWYQRIVEWEVAAQEEIRISSDETLVEAVTPTPSTIETNYQQRIAQLEEIAEEEDISFSKGSTQDFWLFIKEYRPSPQAGVILTDDGNLVAIWRDATGGNVEVEFLGDQQCKMIVFKDPKDPLRVLPEISTDTLASIGQHIGELSFLQSDQ